MANCKVIAVTNQKGRRGQEHFCPRQERQDRFPPRRGAFLPFQRTATEPIRHDGMRGLHAVAGAGHQNERVQPGRKADGGSHPLHYAGGKAEPARKACFSRRANNEAHSEIDSARAGNRFCDSSTGILQSALAAPTRSGKVTGRLRESLPFCGSETAAQTFSPSPHLTPCYSPYYPKKKDHSYMWSV